MRELDLNKLLSNKEEVDIKITQFLEKNILVTRNINLLEIKGHILKADHNLKFIDIVEEQDFNDWALVGCYYASYHIALALILTKGYFSKNHDATLCVLIKYFYNNLLSNEELHLLNMFDANDILFYIQSKSQREKASYSSEIAFDNKLVSEIKIKTIMFVNKVKSIINETNYEASNNV